MVTLPNLADQWQATLGWQPTVAHQEQWQSLYDMLLDANQHLNLTRITTPEDFWEKHLWDSLRGVKDDLTRPAGLRLLDVGSGAGFPGLPLAIARPDWAVTLLEARRKKTVFLESVIQQLALPNAQPVTARAEALAQQPRQRGAYDRVLVRAVGSAVDCARYAWPFVKPGGEVVLYRGQWTETEADQLAAVIQTWGQAVLKVEAFETPLTAGRRHRVVVQRLLPGNQPGAFPAKSR
ncbi:MAG: 16S rRNA (guanine(527)-N(7))-methyltransferase RsmG [Gloeomargaritaceae cyanobacterium C42_A2020_066]|nr:16S rRNA (guanine(527)-N(7))-methyltransferase RsmG [Gloeomargaritaceae cyanobacterium C42_A2020_066]